LFIEILLLAYTAFEFRLKGANINMLIDEVQKLMPQFFFNLACYSDFMMITAYIVPGFVINSLLLP